MYLPQIKGGRTVSRYTLGAYIVVFVTDCESVGMINYLHVAFVYLPDPTDPENKPQIVMAVAAERSTATEMFMKDSSTYFLGVFPGDGHMNLGASPDWADLTKFTRRALEVIAQHLNIQKPPVYIPSQRND
ncbi:MAG: hypothetical protein Kow00117_20080 [Phototrophicales bacterium]